MRFEFFIIRRKIHSRIRAIFVNSKDVILDVGSGKNPTYKNCIKGQLVYFDIDPNKSPMVVGTADQLPFAKQSFDKVISINSLYYVDNPTEALKQIHEVLKENGLFVMVAPFFYPIHDTPHDRYRFTEFGIRSLLKHFSIQEISPMGGIFNVPLVFMHSLMKGAILSVQKHKIMELIINIVFFIPYMLCQVIALLDFIDRSRRFPTYYFVVAKA
jgi:SAM-dependent methyltransferase